MTKCDFMLCIQMPYDVRPQVECGLPAGHEGPHQTSEGAFKGNEAWMRIPFGCAYRKPIS